MSKPAARAAQARVVFVAEPPSAYITRPPLVVDCSVLSAFLFAEPSRDEALRHMTGRVLHAPTLLDHEIANVAVKKKRQNWPAESIDLALSGYAEQEIVLHRVNVSAQVELAERYRLSAYDAAYLWLAAELKVALVTFDQKLGIAAQAHLRELE